MKLTHHRNIKTRLENDSVRLEAIAQKMKIAIVKGSRYLSIV